MKKITILLAFVCSISSAFATPYIPPEQITTHIGRSVFTVPESDATFNHCFEYFQICGFEQPLQVNDPGSNFGGQREEDGGYYWSIIETDNTLEAIWVWSRYYELTGDPQYNDEIADAWVYAYTYPAWLEGAGYYSAHNCAWGLAAELKYRTVFNDSSHWNYAVNCANYIIQTPLSFTSSLNVMVTGWCAGNLYLYGEAVGNQSYMQTAVERGRQITAWVEQDPLNRLGMESWAMSSGTFIWGVCNSYFRSDPGTGIAWLSTYGPMVQVFEPALPSWSNAWNVAYCNAQGAMYDVTGNQTYADNHLNLTNMLLRKDTDNDGGIPASASGGYDASWTTLYLAKMGCDRYMGSQIDAGVLIVNNPRNNTAINLGVPIPVNVTVGNWGNTVLNNVMVRTSGAFVDTVFVNLNPGQNQMVTIGQWTPAVPGVDSIRAHVFIQGDNVTFNNSDIARFRVRTAIASDGALSSTGIIPGQTEITASPNPFNNQINIALNLSENSNIELAVYNIEGRLIETLHSGYTSSGGHNFIFNAGSLASGIYFVRMDSQNETILKKIVLVK